MTSRYERFRNFVDEYVAVKSLVMVLVLSFILYGAKDDVLKVDEKNGIVESVSNGKCKWVNGSTVCFSTLDVLDYDTHLPLVIRVFGEMPMDSLELYNYIIEKESDGNSVSWNRYQNLSYSIENDRLKS